MEWLIGAVAVLFNGAIWFGMRSVQIFESRTGRIPPRSPVRRAQGDPEFIEGSKEFPYLQDFWTNGWFGDLFVFSLIDFAVIASAIHAGFAAWMIASVGPGLTATLIFLYYCLKPERKQADWGFLRKRGKWLPTTGGKIHLGYFFLQASVACLGVLLTLTGNVAMPYLVIGWVGAGLYGIAALRDLHRGLLFP